MIGLIPGITDVRVVADGVLSLTFSDGVHGEVPVLDRMRGPVFAEARTPEGFACAAVDEETGTVGWPGGADLAPTRSTCACRRAPGPTANSPPDVAARPRPNISPNILGSQPVQRCHTGNAAIR